MPEGREKTIRSLCDSLTKVNREQKKLLGEILETLGLTMPSLDVEEIRKPEGSDVLTQILSHLEIEHREARIVSGWLEYLHGELKRI